MQDWLAKMDAGDYGQTWNDAAKSFQKAVTSDQWIAASNSVRTPLGKLGSRKLDSAALQSSTTGVGMPKGTFVIAQFTTSFANLKYARETVTFEKEADGTCARGPLYQAAIADLTVSGAGGMLQSMKILLSLLLAFSISAFVHADWGTDYKAALAQAKAENKQVLLDFTGSDWCGYCKLLDKEVLEPDVDSRISPPRITSP